MPYKDKAKRAAYMKVYAASHKEEEAAYRAAYYATNQEKLKAYRAAYYLANKAEQDASSRAYKTAHRQRLAKAARVKKYGTCGSALFEIQRGRCAICEIDLLTLSERRRQLDHNHHDGAVRGWLCHHCNLGLGNFKDEPKLLKKAMDYLRKTP